MCLVSLIDVFSYYYLALYQFECDTMILGMPQNECYSGLYFVKYCRILLGWLLLDEVFLWRFPPWTVLAKLDSWLEILFEELIGCKIFLSINPIMIVSMERIVIVSMVRTVIVSWEGIVIISMEWIVLASMEQIVIASMK